MNLYCCVTQQSQDLLIFLALAMTHQAFGLLPFSQCTLVLSFVIEIEYIDF